MTHHESFPSTRWTLLEQARDEGPEGRRALAVLLDRYLPALGTYLVEVRRISPDRVDDILQAFVSEKLIQGHLFLRASRSRGRFRSLLLTSLNNFIASQARHDNAQRRDQRKEISIEISDPLVDSSHGPARVFEIEWARALVSEAINRLRQECDSSGRADIWGVFEGRLLAASMGIEPTSYNSIVQKFSLQSPIQASNLLTTAKRMYSRALRAVISEYEPNDERIDAEIAELRDILAGNFPKHYQ